MKLKSTNTDVLTQMKERLGNERRTKESNDQYIIKTFGSGYNNAKVEKCFERVVKGIKALTELCSLKNNLKKTFLSNHKKHKKGNRIKERNYVMFPIDMEKGDWMRNWEDNKCLMIIKKKNKKDYVIKESADALRFIYCDDSSLRNVSEMTGKVLLKCVLNLSHMNILNGFNEKPYSLREFKVKNKSFDYSLLSHNVVFSNITSLQSNDNKQLKHWELFPREDNNSYTSLKLIDYGNKINQEISTSNFHEKISLKTQKISTLKLSPLNSQFTSVNEIINKEKNKNMKNKNTKSFMGKEYKQLPILSLLYMKNNICDNNNPSSSSINHKPVINSDLRLIHCDTTTTLTAINSKKAKAKTAYVLVSLSSSLKYFHKENIINNSLLSLSNQSGTCKEFRPLPQISLSKIKAKRSYNEINKPSQAMNIFLITPSISKYLKRKGGEIIIELKESVDILFDIDSCGIFLDAHDLLDEFNHIAYQKTFDIINKNYLRFASFYIIIAMFNVNQRKPIQEHMLKKKVEEYLYDRFDNVIQSESIRMKIAVSYLRNINELYEHIVIIQNEIRLNKDEKYSLYRLENYTLICDCIKKQSGIMSQMIGKAIGKYSFFNTFEALMLLMTEKESMKSNMMETDENIHIELKKIIKQKYDRNHIPISFT